jgi:hypothetical protein
MIAKMFRRKINRRILAFSRGRKRSIGNSFSMSAASPNLSAGELASIECCKWTMRKVGERVVRTSELSDAGREPGTAL